jgi:putative ABC transport system permease protein
VESLITANIRSRPTRTMISILAVGLGVILVLVLGGIVTGTLDDYLHRNMSVGADFILQPSGSSIFYAMTSGGLNVKLADKLREVPGVSIVAPVLSKFSSSGFNLVFGIDPVTYNGLPGHLKILRGTSSLQGYEAIVDDLYARANHLEPGSTLPLLNHDFKVSGICSSGAVVRVFVPIATLQEINDTPGKATLMFIKAAPGNPVETVYVKIKEALPGYSIVRTSDPALMLADTRMPGFKELNLTVVIVSMLLSFMVILLAMYTTIFERTREIGILKALGASKAFIVGIILRESVMISALGVLFGVASSFAIREAIKVAFPTLQVAMGLKNILHASLLGLSGGTLGALYPAYKAARQDPVKALSHE